jgi:hypothetical protein
MVPRREQAMANTSSQVVKRGSDELEFLKSRARSVPLGTPLAREKVTQLKRRVLTADGQQAAEAHDQGTELVELYMRHADAALGYPTFSALLEDQWPLDLSVAYERMRIARLCTHDQAAKHGYTSCVLGLRIMRMLGTDSFEEFLKQPLPLHPKDGGGTVRFPAPAKQLRSVLRQLAVHAAEGDAADVTRQFRRYRTTVDELMEKDADVAALKPVLWADAKGVYLRVTAGGPAQTRAAAALYQRLARLR